MMLVCPQHRRWTYIRRADGSVAERWCPECPRRCLVDHGGDCHVPRCSLVTCMFERLVPAAAPTEEETP